MIARRADAPPWPELCRLAVGFCCLPALGRWRAGDGTDWPLLPLCLSALLALRVLPAVGRRLLPFPADLQSRWARQRLLAKRFDSYQWRKLIWFGLGLAAAVGLAGPARLLPAGLAAGCLLSGALGALRWRHLVRAEPLAAALAERGRR
jgi:hypothetical protein